MQVKIIDSKKVLMSNDEWKMYEEICKSYDNPPTQRGKDLFTGLFESDENGVIIFLRPPHTRMCSFEVYLFLMSLMQHQHLRLGHKLIADATAKLDEKLKQVDDALGKLNVYSETKKANPRKQIP